jgi:hypothetical protein
LILIIDVVALSPTKKEEEEEEEKRGNPTSLLPTS